jgi:hypothetical protein
MQITSEALLHHSEELKYPQNAKEGRAKQYYPSQYFLLATVVLNSATCLQGSGTHLLQYIIPG